MDQAGKNQSQNGQVTPASEELRCCELIDKGIVSARDFAAAMAAMMADIVSGRIDPTVANAVCNAGGKLLKVVEMQYKYGSKSDGASKKVLNLVDPA